MVYKCAAFGCKSGYMTKQSANSTEGCAANQQDDTVEQQTPVSMHGFPIGNQELLDKWRKALHREDYTITTYSRICSLHFHPSDFIESSQDSNTRRKRTAGTNKLTLRYLKPDAVPSIFPNAPSYLSSKPGNK
jgi:hypothetical protein